tara:strand:- start:25840 stop:26112 length:273 start_codon:yes stop_codon:yes gene_type:complete
VSQLTLAQVKQFCQAADFPDDDGLLQDLQAEAEAWVQDYLRRDLDEEMPDAWPLACIMAAKLIIAARYDDREAEIPGAVREMLAGHRDMS